MVLLLFAIFRLAHVASDREGTFLYLFFWRARECFGHSFAHVAHFVFLRDDWIRTQRAALARRRATNLATHLPGHEIFLL
jgi:hypothetical protein